MYAFSDVEVNKMSTKKSLYVCVCHCISSEMRHADRVHCQIKWRFAATPNNGCKMCAQIQTYLSGIERTTNYVYVFVIHQKEKRHANAIERHIPAVRNKRYKMVIAKLDELICKLQPIWPWNGNNVLTKSMEK